MTDYPQGDAFLTLLLAAMDDAVLEGKLIQFQTQFIPQGSKKYEVIRIIVVPEKMKHTWPTYAPAGTPVKGNHSPDYQTSVKELQYFQQPAGQLIQLDRSQQLWKEGVSGTHLVVYDPLTGETKDIVLLDVTPLTLGIETLGGIATKLIERNTTIPTRKSQIFSTAADGQTSVEIHVVQGERALAKDNFTLGKFQLTGIPPAPRGIPQIEVTFDIDSNGIIHVSAKDLGSGNEQAISIKGDKKLSDEDIKKMMNAAKQFEADDKKKREEIEVRNQADTAVFTAEKMLKESGDKIEAADKQKVEEGVAAVKTALSTDNPDEIKKAMETLTEAVYAATTKIYQKMQAENAAKQQGPQPDGSAGAGAGPTSAEPEQKQDDNVVNADYKVKDE